MRGVDNMICEKIKIFLRQKRKQLIMQTRVITFKKKIQKIKRHKEKMRRKNSLALSIS